MRVSVTGNVSLNSLRTLTKCASLSCLKFLYHLWNQFEKRFFFSYLTGKLKHRFQKCFVSFCGRSDCVNGTNGTDAK